MGLVREFREFIYKGNVIDLAVGVIIGAAFGKIVSGLVEAVIMPVVGLLLGGVSFASMAVRIGGTEAAPVLLKYGVLIQAALDFLIIAACVFLLVKAVNRWRRPAAAACKAACPAQSCPGPWPGRAGR